MHSGKGRLLQGEERIEVGQGDYYLTDETVDVAQGTGQYIQVIAPFGARLHNVHDDGQFVLETHTGKRFDLVNVRKVGYFDKSASDIAYNRWPGEPRTEITVHFGKAIKQQTWRPSLLAHGVP